MRTASSLGLGFRPYYLWTVDPGVRLPLDCSGTICMLGVVMMETRSTAVFCDSKGFPNQALLIEDAYYSQHKLANCLGLKTLESSGVYAP